MRLEPVGKDMEGTTYWYFYGIRLYKEVNTLTRKERNNIEQVTKDIVTTKVMEKKEEKMKKIEHNKNGERKQ